MSVFEGFRAKAFPYRYAGQIMVTCIAGGTPTDPRVGEAWLRSKLADKDDLMRQAVAETMVEMKVGLEEAAAIVDSKQLNGFKRYKGGLYIEGRQLKAALKEAAMVAANAGKIDTRKWGSTADAAYKKGLKGWFPEHVFVVEDRLPLGVTEATGIMQRFVHTWRGTGIQYEEYVENAVIDFTVATDHNFAEKDWAMIWLTGEQQGIGASRSQGYGRYEVTRWEPVTTVKARRAA